VSPRVPRPSPCESETSTSGPSVTSSASGQCSEGSVRRTGDRVRLSARLISTSDGYQLWSESYDRQLADIFEVQDELARAIVSALKVQHVGQADQRLVEPPTDDVKAYELYLKGRFFSNRRTPEGLRKGIEYFE
jgi:hypothetical protein